jgi:hypothetical protein
MITPATAIDKIPNREYSFLSIILPLLSPAGILTYHVNIFSKNE